MEIRSSNIPLEVLKNYFLTYPKNIPDYLKKMPKHFDEKNPNTRTVKTCSGLLNLYTRSVLFTSPFDIQVNFNKDGSWKAYVGHGGLGDNTVSDVPYQQFFKHKDNKKYKALLKFSFGINVQYKYPVHLNNPWWSLNNFETVPGVLNCKNPLDLNFFIPIETNVEILSIPQGTPLILISSEVDSKIKLRFTKKPFDNRLINGLHYRFSTLKDMLLRRKFDV
tara:strand:- start:514 stop:1176 length:663 start_codon:yes stop_codon:yes gene_type:complete